MSARLPHAAVEPTEEAEAFMLDLRDWFELTSPGSYRPRFTFTSQNSGFADGESRDVIFSLFQERED